MKELEVTVITDFSVFETHAEEWNQLWSSMAHREIFGTFEWARAWWKAFGDDCSLCTPVVRRHGEIIGILPLISQGKRLKFLGTGTKDYNDLICPSGTTTTVLSAALQSLFNMPISWNLCFLEYLREDSYIAENIKLLPNEIRSHLHLTYCATCSNIKFDAQGDILTNILKKKHLRRKENGLARLGTLQFHHIESRDEIKSHLPRLFDLDIARCKLADRESIFHHDSMRDFYRNLVDELDPKEHLRFSILHTDEQTIAYHLGFELDGKFLAYKPVFDPDLARLSPGEVLFKKMFEYAGSRQLQSFDFTIGDEGFKSRFANEMYSSNHLYLFPHGITGKICRVCLQIKDEAKKHPRLYRMMKKLLRK